MNHKKTINVLFVADIIGKPGFETTQEFLPKLKDKFSIDFCIANGENGANGKGLTESIAKRYFDLGIDVVTGGNHSWTNAGFRNFLNLSKRVLRPHNYPHEAPGSGTAVFELPGGFKVGIINLQGRTFMYPIECPFKTALEEIERIRQKTNIIIVDMHAEASAEKIALAWYLDGKVSAVIGTHTHVQTADERILPKGTAYITDAGMTGPHDTVIGMDVETAIKRFLYQIPERYIVGKGNNRLCGVVIEIDSENGRAVKIQRINVP